MKRGSTNAKRKPLAVVVEPVVLHPCPFCGAVGYLLAIEAVKDQHGNLFNVVRCGGCLCDGPMSLSTDGAATSWNIRFAIMQNPAIHPSAHVSCDVRGAIGCST